MIGTYLLEIALAVGILVAFRFALRNIMADWRSRLR